LNAERIVLMIAHCNLQVRQVDLTFEPSRGRNADMAETRSREYLHFFAWFRKYSEVFGRIGSVQRFRRLSPEIGQETADGKADCIYCEQRHQSLTFEQFDVIQAIHE
jgi:hypothetical protein